MDGPSPKAKPDGFREMLAGVEKIASQVQESKGKPAVGEGSEKASKAQHVGDMNRKLIRALAESVQAQGDAMASAKGIASGQGRAAHAAILALACASESTDESQQGALSAVWLQTFNPRESGISGILGSTCSSA